MNIEKLSEAETEFIFLWGIQKTPGALTEHISAYTMPQLIKTIARIIDQQWTLGRKYPEKTIIEIINSLLWERKRRIEKDFQWDEKSINQLKKLNEEFRDASKKAWQEAIETADALEKRICKRDSFLKDYEIALDFSIYPDIKGNREAAELIGTYLAEESHGSWFADISHCHYNRHTSPDDLPLIADERTNFNEWVHREEWKDINFCFMTHQLLENRAWSIPDILSVRGVWADVQVTHQYDKRIPKERKTTK